MNNPALVRLRQMLTPSMVLDRRALPGTNAIADLPDVRLLSLAKKLLVGKVEAETIASEFLPATDREEAVLALRRLMLIGRSLTPELQEMESSEDAESSVPLFGPDEKFVDVLKDCQKASKSLDVVQQLAILAEMQQRRVVGMLQETSKFPTRFMHSDKVDRGMELLRKTLETLHVAQERAGIVEKRPETLNVRLQGALQHYLGGMNESDKSQLVEFGERFCNRLEQYGRDEQPA